MDKRITLGLVAVAIGGARIWLGHTKPISPPAFVPNVVRGSTLVDGSTSDPSPGKLRTHFYNLATRPAVLEARTRREFPDWQILSIYGETGFVARKGGFGGVGDPMIQVQEGHWERREDGSVQLVQSAATRGQSAVMVQALDR